MGGCGGVLGRTRGVGGGRVRRRRRGVAFGGFQGRRGGGVIRPSIEEEQEGEEDGQRVRSSSTGDGHDCWDAELFPGEEEGDGWELKESERASKGTREQGRRSFRPLFFWFSENVSGERENPNREESSLYPIGLRIFGLL